MTLDLLAGRRRISGVVNFAAAGIGNSANILVWSTTQLMVGAKTLKIKRLKIRNNNAGNTWFHIGTGVGGAFVDGIPALYAISNTTDDYDEYDLPQWEIGGSISGYPEAVGAGSFDVQVEAEEIG